MKQSYDLKLNRELKLEEIIEGLDLFYDPKEKGWKPSLIKGIQESLYDLDGPIKVPHRAAHHVRLLKGPNIEFVKEGASYTPVQEFVSDVVKKCKSIPHGIIRKTMFNVAEMYLDEDGMAKDLYALSKKEDMVANEIEYFLSKFTELYRKRDLINLIEKTYANTQSNTVPVYPIFIHTGMMNTIESLLVAEGEINKVFLENMVCSLHTRVPGHMGDAFSSLCVRYLKSFVKESGSRIKEDRLEVFHKACESMEKEISILSMTPPVGVVAREFEDIKIQNDIQLFNIVAEAFGSDFLIQVRESHHDPDSLIGDVHHLVKGVDLDKCIKRYGNLTTEIEPSDVFKLSHSKRINFLRSVENNNGSTVHFNANHLNLELVCKDLDTSDIILFSLMEEGTMIQSSLQLFKTSNDEEARCPTLPITRLKFKSPEELTYGKESINLIIEGLKISEDGGIKLTYTPKKSYMDEYAQAHKVIHENSKSGNFEAMKTDLAFLFAFINHIESQIMYSKSASTSKREDAMKARMFAINDFKTYLKKVQQDDPGFDFTRYYESLDTSKVLVEFTNNEIKGIRKLLRTILM